MCQFIFNYVLHFLYLKMSEEKLNISISDIEMLYLVVLDIPTSLLFESTVFGLKENPIWNSDGIPTFNRNQLEKIGQQRLLIS